MVVTLQKRCSFLVQVKDHGVHYLVNLGEVEHPGPVVHMVEDVLVLVCTEHFEGNATKTVEDEGRVLFKHVHGKCCQKDVVNDHQKADKGEQRPLCGHGSPEPVVLVPNIDQTEYGGNERRAPVHGNFV